jgi:hypothetical protein
MGTVLYATHERGEGRSMAKGVSGALSDGLCCTCEAGCAVSATASQRWKEEEGKTVL